jgi:uncharacterized RDD family membrane protein YckC
MSEFAEQESVGDLLSEGSRAFAAPLVHAPSEADVPPAPTLQPPDAAIGAGYALSGWWARVGAVLVDDIALLVPVIIVAVVLHQYQVTHYITTAGTIGTTTTVHYTWIETVMWLLYATFLLVRVGRRNGQTLGKQSAGIRVVRNDGKPVDFATVFMREWIGKALFPALLIELAPLLALAFLAYWLVDYLLPLVEPENRALHDLIAGTHVVRLDDSGAKRFSPARV